MSQEQVIRCIIQDPDLIITKQIKREEFSGDSLVTWDCIQEQLTQSQVIDISVLTKKVIEQLPLDRAMQAVDTVEAIPAAIDVYLKQMRADADSEKLRRLIIQLQDCHQKNKSPESVLEKYTLSTLTEETIPAKEQLPGMIDEIQEAYNYYQEHREKKMAGCSTGYSQLDSMLSGWQPGKLYYIAARPSEGKTALVCNMLIKAGVPSGLISGESSQKEILYRLLAIDSKVSGKRLKEGDLVASDFAKLTDSAGRIYDMPVHISDVPNPSLSEIKGKARLWKKKHDIKVLYIDYLLLIKTPEGLQRMPRTYQIEGISHALKQIARDLGIAVVCLTQIGRRQDNSPPQLHHLKDSGAIEQDADGVLMLHHPDPDDQDREHADYRDVILYIRKARDEETGKIEMKFVKKNVSFLQK